MEGISIQMLEVEGVEVLLGDREVPDPEEGSIMGDKLCILTPLRKCNIIKIFH